MKVLTLRKPILLQHRIDVSGIGRVPLIGIAYLSNGITLMSESTSKTYNSITLNNLLQSHGVMDRVAVFRRKRTWV